ncbi:cysteine protease family c02 [Stylonychia lemnae]|uniref:Cysteine protease family c02 n=1 Tax=Stylonychia lemnae TaxID=5949 RepID=A0A078AMF6_STYLE|nr:cysteine protease family c02 [Stylonychia lemnae]|eukprot:CDW83096.1 cysteine protease family c02 [Stylonychia lemnae]
MSKDKSSHLLVSLKIFNHLQNVKNDESHSSKDLVKQFLSITKADPSEIDALDGDFAAENAFEAFEELFSRFEVIGQEYLKLRADGNSPKKQPQKQDQRGQNFDQMITAIDKIVKLQAWFRKELTIKRLEKQLKETKTAFVQKKERISPEEAALQEFSQQLMNKNLTPESFFRICDPDYKQSVQAAIFKDQLQKLGLKLSRGQLSRLIMILDEDMEGNITRDEYYNALEAYCVSGEKHKSFDGTIYHPFEHKALFKLIVELKKKNISFVEMFNACDINDDTRVNIAEIQRFIEGLSPEFKQKELHALMNYLDIDKNGLVDKDEFIRQLNKGEQTYRQSQVLNKQLIDRQKISQPGQQQMGRSQAAQRDNLFEEVDVGGGDQSVFGFVDNLFSKKKDNTVQDKPPAKQVQAKQNDVLDADTQRRKNIIMKMEKEGQNFNTFFNSMKAIVERGAINLGQLLSKLENSYPTISTQDRSFLVRGVMIDAKRIDYVQLEQLFTRFSKNLQPTVSNTFSIIAGNIIRRMGGLQPHDAIRQFFRAQNIRENDSLSEVDFNNLFSGKFEQITKFQLEQAFKSLDVELDGFIQVSDLIDVLASYNDSQQKNSTFNIKDIGLIIPGFESMSPRTRCDELIQLIIAELNKKNMKPINVYKMADIKNTGAVQIGVLEQTFRKILPSMKSEIIQESLNAFNCKTTRDMVTRQDFETLFQDDQNQFIPNSQSLSSKNLQQTTNLRSSAQSLVPQAEEEYLVWIRKLDNAMLRERISPGVAFRAADINHNGVVTVDELKDSIKRLIPQDTLSLVDLKKIMMAFDRNKNGLIEEDEFISLIEKARNSNLTMIDSPQKSRGPLFDSSLNDRRQNLPMRTNDLSQQQNNQESIELIMLNLSQRANLKKLFSDVHINEDCTIGVLQLSQRLKTVRTNDGTSLRSSEYIQMIKHLDKQQRGVVFVKDLIDFLQKHTPDTFKTDCTLELRYIANLIEFQFKSRFTKQYLLNNTNLRDQLRILEVEVLTEFQKAFKISMEIGRLIFQLALQQRIGSSEVTLDDLVRLIDQYRVLKHQAPQLELEKTASAKVDTIKALTSLVMNMMCLTNKKREEINSRIEEIGEIQKGIPFLEFFQIFNEQYQIIEMTECKALYRYLASLGPHPNIIQLGIFQEQIQQRQSYILECQSKAIGLLIQQLEKNVNGELFNDMSKIKLDDIGHFSRKGLKDFLMKVQVLNVNQNPQISESSYVKFFLNLVKMPNFQMRNQLQADYYLDYYVFDNSDTVKFWNVIEFFSSYTKNKAQFTSVILLYMAKLFDNIVPLKSCYSALEKLCPQCLNLRDGNFLVMMIEKLQDTLIISQKLLGFNQGEMRQSSRECVHSILQLLQSKTAITDENHELLKYINQFRAFKARGGDSGPSQQKQVNPEDIIKQLEIQTGDSIEDAVAFIYDKDKMPATNFQMDLNSRYQGRLEKSITTQFIRLVDSQMTGSIFTKNLIQLLKGIPGKFDLQATLKQLVQNIEEPIETTLEYNNYKIDQDIMKEDYLELIQRISNITKFQALCLFYHLEVDGERSILASKFVQLVKPYQQKGSLLNDSREERKQVRFDEVVRNEDTIKSMCQQFVKDYEKISSSNVVLSGMKQFTAQMNKEQSAQNAATRLHPQGKGQYSVDMLKTYLDQNLKRLSEEEKLAVCFIPIAKTKNDPMIINQLAYAQLARQLKLDPIDINQLKIMLETNLKQVKAYLGIKEQAVSQTQEKKKGKTDLNQIHQKEIQKQSNKMKDVIAELKVIAENKQQKQLIIDFFVNCKNQKATHSVFHHFLKNQLKMKSGEQQIDYMTSLIDSEMKGKVQFLDFIDFCKKFGIPLESELARKATVKVKDKKGETLTCGSLTYTLTEDDYFTTWSKSIFANEKSALVVAEKLYQECKARKKRFIDLDFGPKHDYCTGETPKGYIDPDQMVWLTPDEIDTKNQKPQFLDDGPAPNDVKQGKLGDCWFIGALSVIATRDELLRGSIGDQNKSTDFQADQKTAELFSRGVYPPLFHIYRDVGLYVFRFFKEFGWRYVIIDDRIPCFQYSRRPVFGQCKAEHEFWVALIEKAYAKLHGCYESLISGFIDDALNDMTGLVAEKIFLHNEQKIFPHKNIKDKDEFWKFLMRSAKQKCMMGCSVVGDVERQIVIDGQKTGIMTGHAYGIIDVFEIQSSIKTHRLLRIRNPWGEMEWKGKWSDHSEEIEVHKDLIQKYTSELAIDEQFTPGEEDGTFLINFRSWRDLFNNMYICVDFPDDWTGIRFKGCWDETCSGGIPSPMTVENMQRWGKNPQYCISVEQDFEIFISLAQQDGRSKRDDGKYLKFPYSEIIHPILFTVLELPSNQRRMEQFNKALVKGASVLKEHREVSLRLKLPAGRYIIVPSTRNEKEYGPYTLSIYVNLGLDDFEIEKILDENNNQSMEKDGQDDYVLIAEEMEQYTNVEDWKIELCEERIQYMIFQEDELNNSRLTGSMNNSKNNTQNFRSGLFNQSAAKMSFNKQDDYEQDEFPDDDKFME